MKIFGMFICILCSMNASAQKPNEKADRAYENMKELVSNRKFSFNADSASPISGRSQSMTTNDNFLDFKKDSVAAYLPYFGEVTTSIDYSGEGAIAFNTKPLKYNMRINDRKRRITIVFNALGKSGLYRVVLEINGSGFANLLVKSINRTGIRYYGRVQPLKAERNKR